MHYIAKDKIGDPCIPTVPSTKEMVPELRETARNSQDI
jgi:hypothetical protein